MARSKVGRKLAILGLLTASILGGAVTTTTAVATADASTPMTISGVPVECGGAKAYVSVRFWNARQMAVRFTLNDTAADGKTPKILFSADNNYQGQLNYGGGWVQIPYGDDSVSGDFSWDPSSVDLVHNLLVTVKNGTDAQGASCTQAKRIWNYSQLARRVAEFQEGDRYLLGAEGPDLFDCSGLLQFSYANTNVGNAGGEIFPNLSSAYGVRTAEQQMDLLAGWASNGVNARYDAMSVAPADRQPGDLVFYNWSGGRRADHVAFWEGDGRVFDGHTAGVPVGYHTESASWRSQITAVFRVAGVSG